MGTGIITFAGTLALMFMATFAGPAGWRAWPENQLTAYLWWIGGLLPILLICVMWTRIGDQPKWAIKSVLSIVLVAIGALAGLATAEAVYPAAGKEPMLRSERPPPVPPIAGSGNIVTTNQSGGINNTGTLTINQADYSPHRKIRDFLNLLDTRILSLVSQGQAELNVRMQPNDVAKLNSLILEAGSSPGIQIQGLGRKFIDSAVMNGSLGPSQPVHEQTEVLIKVDKSLTD